ncbi:MAG: hypothetical protein IKK58_04465 [Clostridia bacterium]|nr:hypothetical protein [Clostridia bacterium]
MQQNPSYRQLYSFIAPIRKKNVAIVFFLIIFAILLYAAVSVYMMLPTDNTSNLYTYLFVACGVLLATCLILLIALIVKQEKVNTLFSSIITVFEYNSRYLYRFYRQQAMSIRPVASIVFIIISLLLIIAGVAVNTTDAVSEYSGYVYLAAAFCIVLTVLVHPYVRTVLNYRFCMLLGKDKHIAVSYRGVLTSRRLVDFGNNSMTFFKAEQRRMGSFYCLSFYYHRRRGYAVGSSVYDIPLPPDVDQETVDELLGIFNSSELFMNSRPSYMM